MQSGWLTVGHWRRIPIRVHWSAPIGAWFWTGQGFRPALWLTFLGMVLVHEMGHAIVVRRARGEVLTLSLHGMGGECSWRGHATPMQRACIAWGGVWAQAVLLVAATLAIALGVGPALGGAAPDVLDFLVYRNATNMAFNLLPVKPLDGAEAWPIVPLLLYRLKGVRLRRKHRWLERRMRKLRSVD